jgi:hypothetical protein
LWSAADNTTTDGDGRGKAEGFATLGGATGTSGATTSAGGVSTSVFADFRLRRFHFLKRPE